MKRFISIILSLITILTVLCSFQTSAFAEQKPSKTQFTDYSTTDSRITLQDF